MKNNNDRNFIESCDDKLDFEKIRQLHEATLQISNQCFEFKKLCVGVIGVVITALIKIGSSESWFTISFVSGIIGVGFWLCDATAYIYQKRLRKNMSGTIQTISQRHSKQSRTDIHNKEVNADVSVKVFDSYCKAWIDLFKRCFKFFITRSEFSDALFNLSMSLYYCILIVCGFVMFISSF